MTESDPVDHSEGIYLGYSQSKWVSERLVAIARPRTSGLYLQTTISIWT